ncbi:glycosyltransferase family 4 protein [Desulfonatronum parangueonense]
MGKIITVWLPYIKGGSGADVSTEYLAEGLRRAGAKVIAQPFHLYFQFAPWLLSRATAPEDASIILTNSWNGFAFARPGKHLVVVDRLCVHDPVLERYKSFAQKVYHNHLIRRYVTASAKRADAVVAVSNYTADQYPKVLALPRPEVILNAVDTNFFKPLDGEKSKPVGHGARLLFVGNLTSRKGVDMLAPIMQRLGPDYELYYTAGLRAKDIPGKLPNMHPLGQLDQRQMVREYRKADLLLFPSRGEGLSRAVMESQACGTPVVAADVSSMPEAVDDTVGRLCPLDDPEAFAAAVRDLLMDPAQYARLAANARMRAEERFSLDRMIWEYIDLFYTLQDGAQGKNSAGGRRQKRAE